MSNEPLYPTSIKQVYATSIKKTKLNNVTWCLNDKPCKTLSAPLVYHDWKNRAR
jgi:hypothetical protein